MASNYTSNYNLCQWAAGDKVLRTEFNADNAKIDAAIKAVDRRVSAVDSSKASASALETVKSALEAQGSLVELRNCRFVTGSYTGTGKYGTANANSLSFAQKPVFLCVSPVDYVGAFLAVRGQNMVFHMVHTDQVKQVVSWGSKSVSWYNEANLSAGSPKKQLNENGQTYFYFAILEL